MDVHEDDQFQKIQENWLRLEQDESKLYIEDHLANTLYQPENVVSDEVNVWDEEDVGAQTDVDDYDMYMFRNIGGKVVVQASVTFTNDLVDFDETVTADDVQIEINNLLENKPLEVLGAVSPGSVEKFLSAYEGNDTNSEFELQHIEQIEQVDKNTFNVTSTLSPEGYVRGHQTHKGGYRRGGRYPDA